MSTSIRHLYRYAVAEGEGVGTAYEYYAKRRVIAPLLAGLPAKPRVVVAGLPEKYGTSLDFLLVAEDLGAHLVVLDDRQAAIDRARRAVDALGGHGELSVASLTYEVVPLAAIPDAAKGDLLLSCEVVQRVPEGARVGFVLGLRSAASRGALFVPNSANGSHLSISGLGGLDEGGMRALVGPDAAIGYVDMPPFPPGITRSADQREKASSGRFEAWAMAGLQLYCEAERLVPAVLASRVAHIVYARWP